MAQLKIKGSMTPGALTLRPMGLADLGLVGGWMLEPHVARWYLAGSTVVDELEELRQGVAGEHPTCVLLAAERGRPVGWCQWYRLADYPEHAAGMGVDVGDVGIDYAIGDPTRVGRGVGTALIVALVEHIRQHQPGAGLVADPEASNMASRRVLEKNGFALLGERAVPSERTTAPMAIYRLAPPGEGLA